MIPGEGEDVALCLCQFGHQNLTLCTLWAHYALLKVSSVVFEVFSHVHLCFCFRSVLLNSSCRNEVTNQGICTCSISFTDNICDPCSASQGDGWSPRTSAWPTFDA